MPNFAVKLLKIYLKRSGERAEPIVMREKNAEEIVTDLINKKVITDDMFESM